MRVLRGLLLVTRPENPVIALVATLIGAKLAAAPFSLPVLLSAVAIALLVASADAINDVFDVEIDRVNRPERPIPSGQVTRAQVLCFAIVLDLIGVGLGALVNLQVALICIASMALNILYCWKLKGTVLLGNLIIAVLLVVPLFLGGASAGNTAPVILPCLIALSFTLGREILMDAHDVPGDQQGGARTLAVVYGQRAALILATLCFLAFILLDPIPYLMNQYSTLYMILMLIASLATIIMLGRVILKATPPNIKAAVVGTKFILLLAMVALLVA